jgi:hypothetical protein
MKGTLEDDLWVLNRVKDTDTTGLSSYRYADPNDVVHRAVWHANKWLACCGDKVTKKLPEGDVDAITCVRCIGSGA